MSDIRQLFNQAAQNLNNLQSIIDEQKDQINDKLYKEIMEPLTQARNTVKEGQRKAQEIRNTSLDNDQLTQ